MANEFWIKKWEQQDIGFHQDQIHPLLIRNWHLMRKMQNQLVFVPLCGKSKDMLWLASQGLTVIGVELSQLAIESFFIENNITFRTEKTLHHTLYSGGSFHIYQGDYFDLGHDEIGAIRSVYDRAALIAMFPQQRARYISHLMNQIDADADIFLISIEHANPETTTPPFPLLREEIETLFSESIVRQIDAEPADLRGKPCVDRAYLIM